MAASAAPRMDVRKDAMHSRHPTTSVLTGNQRKQRERTMSWHDHPMMSVVGCIDSNGAITARACKDISGHRPEESRGKRWRFLVWSQEFNDLAPRSLDEANNLKAMLQLNDEEHFAVCDWLIKHGFADDQILTPPAPINPTREG
jgi:hypothetical protein